MACPMRNAGPVTPLHRALMLGTLVVGATLAWRGALFAHAMLLSSDPKAGSVLARSPERVRLVFSEAIDAAVSGIRVVPLGAAPIDLSVAADPRDAKALVAPLASLVPGRYRIVWRSVSVDGHAVNGSFGFTVRGDTTAAPSVVPPILPPIFQMDTLPPSASSHVPVIAGLLRGMALGFLMALAGVLFFSRRAAVDSPRASRVCVWLAATAVVLLAAHLVAWVSSSAAERTVDLAWGRSMIGTAPGKLDLARLVAAALALCALALARQRSLALLFAAGGLVISGAMGHPAAIHSLWTIPAKAIHLCAGATWLGGLLWLILANSVSAEAFAVQARRVSTVALVSVVLVVFSGIIQTRFFLATPSDLIRTTYGIFVLLKIAGVLILIAFGAYHRSRLLPSLADADAGIRLRESVRFEIGVFTLVVLLGGLLAYLPAPGGYPVR